jgi:poly-gamma-glutamate capsule biosynthesis protein CapA/YwtB (metallophosphatase superfamily)
VSISSRIRRISLFGFAAAAVLVFGGLLAAGRQQPQTPSRDPARELAMSVGDGFTLTAVGDLIFARPIAQLGDPAFAGVVQLLQRGDVTFGNFEGSAIDIPRFTGYPAAEFGGVWIIGPPEVAKDLKTMGFDMVSRANNHATDWGVEGMRLTSDALDAAGLVHAGVGETRAAARAARYFETGKGRVAVVSMASSFTPMSMAMDPVGEARGRPGLSAVRTTRHVLVTREELERLRTIRNEQPRGAIRPDPDEPKDIVALFGTTYEVGDRRGYTYTINPVDEGEILTAIRHAKWSADFVIATIHAHDPGNWSEEPADFLPALAKKAIDAGADAWVGHGPHQLRGIEIYNGKPIFYSLGDFIFQLDLLQPVGQDLYERFKKDPGTVTDAEFSTFWTDRTFEGDVWYQSVIAESRFASGRLAEIRLHPVDLGAGRRAANRGVPRLATPDVARVILERVQRLSKAFGTTIAIENGVGVIRLPAPSSAAGMLPRSRPPVADAPGHGRAANGVRP